MLLLGRFPEKQRMNTEVEHGTLAADWETGAGSRTQ